MLNVREMIAVPDEVFGERDLVALGQSVASDPALFDMRGGNRQDVPFHLPVENPIQVCAAYGGGCGRPSIQMVRVCS